MLRIAGSNETDKALPKPVLVGSNIALDVDVKVKVAGVVGEAR